MKCRRVTVRTLTIATGLLLAAGQAHAADRFWINPMGGVYSDPGNWSGGFAPTSTDHGVFNIGGAYTVSVPSNFQVGGFKGRSGVVTIDMLGNQFTMDGTFQPGSVIAGELAGDDGDLTIRNGSIRGRTIVVGAAAGSTGALRFLGPFSWQPANGAMTVGQSGDGLLEVQNLAIGESTSMLVSRIDIGVNTGSMGRLHVHGIGSISVQASEGALNFRPINVGINGEGTLEVDAGTVRGSTLTVGPAGRVVMSNGTVLSNQNSVFNTAPPFNAIEMTGGTLRASGSLILRGSGAGATRAVMSAGTIRADAGISMGALGDAEIEADGGQLHCQSSALIMARAAGVNAEITLRNTTLQCANSFIRIGEYGHGVLSMSQGSTGFASSVGLGEQPGASGALELDGAGTLLTLSSSLISGMEGSGLVSITDGAMLTTPAAIAIATSAGADGTIALNGADSLLKTTSGASNSINVGNSGSGFLNVFNGGRVESDGGMNVGSTTTGGFGEATFGGPSTTLQVTQNINILNGSLFTVSNGATVECRGFFPAESARTTITGQGTKVVAGVGGAHAGSPFVALTSTLSIDDDAELEAPFLDVNDGAVLEGRRGVITANLTNKGKVLPGVQFLQDADRLSHFDINGDFTQTATGELHIDINHDIAGAADNDALHITGAASLAGALIVEIAEDTGGPVFLGAPFDPQPGDAWDILTASNVTGTFDTESLPALSGDKFFVVEYEADRVRLVVRISCPADLTGSGSVGSADLAHLLGLWGACPAPCPADLTGDGFVGSGDLGVLLGSWGPCPSFQFFRDAAR